MEKVIAFSYSRIMDWWYKGSSFFSPPREKRGNPHSTWMILLLNGFMGKVSHKQRP